MFKKKPAPGDNKPGSGDISAPGYKKPENPRYNSTYKNDRGMDYNQGGLDNTSAKEYEVNKTSEYIKPEDDPRNYKFGTYIPPKPAQGNDEYTILRELENLFNQGQQTQPSKPPATVSGNVNRSADPMEHKQSSGEVTQDPYERSMKVEKMDTSLRPSDHYIKESKLDRNVRKSDHEITTFKRTVKVSQEQEDLAKSFALNTKKQDDRFILFNKDLRSRLRHPETLKDYVIISEILGKPKAFE